MEGAHLGLDPGRGGELSVAGAAGTSGRGWRWRGSCSLGPRSWGGVVFFSPGF